MHPVPDRHRWRWALASRTGNVLRFVDLACGWVYIAGSAAFGAWLGWFALTISLAFWMIAVPVLATAVMLGTGLWRRPGLGLHLEWPFSGYPRARKDRLTR